MPSASAMLAEHAFVRIGREDEMAAIAVVAERLRELSRTIRNCAIVSAVVPDLLTDVEQRAAQIEALEQRRDRRGSTLSST